MKKEPPSKGRILGWRLARTLDIEHLRALSGRGTSFAGTGGCDGQGRGADGTAVDCVEGNDTWKC